MTTTVVVLSYRPGEWLAGCLASVRDQADEIVVVDNASADGRASELGRQAGALVLRSKTNLGFAAGVNRGVSAARGDVVALLNDDAEAGAEWLPSSVEVLRDPSIAAVSPKVVLSSWYREVCLPDEEWWSPGDWRALGRQLEKATVEGTDVLEAIIGAGIYPTERRKTPEERERWRWTSGPRPFYVPVPAPTGEAEIRLNGLSAPDGPSCRLVNSAGIYLRPDGYAGDIGLGAPDDGRFDVATDRFALSGTAMAFRADTWRRLGGFASPFFAYYEDVDWCWRAALAGLRLRYDPTARVLHRRSATSGGATDPRVRVLAEANRTLCMVRNGPRPRVLRAVRRRWIDGPDGGVRRRIVRQLPWALATRSVRFWRWKRSPDEVWNHWSGRDVTWDDSPAQIPAR